MAALLVLSGLGSAVGLAGNAAGMHELRGRSGDVDVRGLQPAWASVAGQIGFPVTILLVVLFLVWFHGAYGAALARKGDRKGGIGLTTAFWLVPVLNLLLCFGAVATIWDAGSDDGADGDRSLLLGWWISGTAAVLAVVAGIGLTVSTVLRVFGEAMDRAQTGADPSAIVVVQSASEQRAALVLGLVAAISSMVAASLAALFVLVSTHRLGARTRLGQGLTRLPARILTTAVGAVVLGTSSAAVLAGSAV